MERPTALGYGLRMQAKSMPIASPACSVIEITIPCIYEADPVNRINRSGWEENKCTLR